MRSYGIHSIMGRCDDLMIANILCSFIGTITFSLLFNVPKKYYFYCGLVGTLGWMCYCGMSPIFSATFSTFISTMVVVLSSRILTVVRKCPITIFLISGIFPLVPGASVYNTAYYFITNDLDSSLAWGINALKIAFAIVLGIVFIVSIPREMFTKRYWDLRRLKKTVVTK